MPTGFPRVILYDPKMECHLTVVVRHDHGMFSYFCADHGTEEVFPLSMLEQFKETYKGFNDVQVVSWIEVTDDGC